MSAPDIVAFIEARLADIEDLCAKTTQGDWKSWGMTLLADQGGHSDLADAVKVADVSSPPQFDHLRTWNQDHIQYWQPRRARAFVASQRRIVERYKGMRGIPLASSNRAGMWVALGEVLIDLASLWREHPDWDESWEVEDV